MSIPFVYIDQNIIGGYLQGYINLGKREDLKWIYSEEHFKEIKRSNEPEKYLSALDDIGAQMLKIVINDKWMLTGEAQLIHDKTPFENYEDYIEAIGDVDFDDSIVNPFIAWLNGGAEAGTPKKFVSELIEETSKLISTLPFKASDLLEKLQDNKEKFDRNMDVLIENGNDIKKTRAAFGNEKGAIGCISGEGQLKKIWAIISPSISDTGIGCDQFFGFDPIDKQGYEVWPLYLGIIQCNSIFDILGFNSEQKCRKIDKIENIRSDAGHIAIASYCTTLLSMDRRLVNRANAIYEYKNIGTSAKLIERPPLAK